MKLGKPKQDTRFDVPVFGLETLRAMEDAGISNAVLESSSVLLLRKDQVLEEAKQLNMGIIGIQISTKS